MSSNVRSHLVARSYLLGFASDEQVIMRPVDAAPAIRAGVDNVAVVRNFYRRQRPDGTYIQDVERAMSPLEDQAASRLRTIRCRWPLERDDRGVLAEYMALQLVRGQRWRAWHDEMLRLAVHEHDADVSRSVTLPQRLRDMEAFLASDTQRLARMIDLHPKIGTVLASMHWGLVTFEEQLLATGDEPIIPWPLKGIRTPAPFSFQNGIRETLEVRFAVTARDLLVMSWLDEPNDEPPLRGLPAIARNHNTFVKAQAQRFWFHHPDTKPLVSRGRLPALSPLLHPGYNLRAARVSRRRAQADELTRPHRGRPGTGAFRFAEVHRRTA